MTDADTRAARGARPSFPPGAHESCPSCGATLPRPGRGARHQGRHLARPEAIIQARADVARPRNRIMSFITGETPSERTRPPTPSRSPRRTSPSGARCGGSRSRPSAPTSRPRPSPSRPTSSSRWASRCPRWAAPTPISPRPRWPTTRPPRWRPSSPRRPRRWPPAVAAPSGTPPAASAPTPPPPAPAARGRRRCPGTRRRRRLGLRPVPARPVSSGRARPPAASRPVVPARAGGPHRRPPTRGRHGEARGRSRRLVARRAVGRRRRRRRELPRRGARRRPAAGAAARAPGPVVRGRAVGADPRGGRPPGDPPHAARPAGGRHAAVALPARDPGRVPLGAGARRDAAARTRSRTGCSARSDARSRTCRGPEAPVPAWPVRQAGSPGPPIRPRAIRPRLRAMGDLFDDFMRELERRRAEAEGRAPKDDSGDPTGPRRPRPARPGRRRRTRRTTTARRGRARRGRRRRRPRRPIATTSRRPTARRRGPPDVARLPPSTPERGHAAAEDRPTPGRRARRRRRAAERRRTSSAGPGSGSPSSRSSRSSCCSPSGIDLWTDAIWYKSVGFDSVFWTRLGVQVGLFVGAGLLALIVLLGNLLLANRLDAAARSRAAGPPAGPSPAGSSRRSARPSATPARARPAARSGPFGAAGSAVAAVASSASASTPRTCPTSSRSGRGSSPGSPCCSRSASRAPCRARGRRCCCGSTACRSRPTQTVVDPIFGRDISFFLFELPFYRFVQSLVNGLLLASLVVAGARYLLATTRGGEVFVTRVRVHLAVLGGLYLLSVAFGYQLDKYELVYSQAGRRATGVAFADANARFLAYDVLTFLSGLAGRPADRGRVHPLDVAARRVILIVWFSASIVLGRLYPEAIQRLSVDPNTYAQEEPYIANNIAMTRLAFGLDQWAVAVIRRRGAADRGGDPERGGHVHERAPVGLPPPADDPRPAPGRPPVLRLPRRRHRPLHDRRHAAPGDAVGPRAGDRRKDPDAPNWVNQRVI